DGHRAIPIRIAGHSDGRDWWPAASNSDIKSPIAVCTAGRNDGEAAGPAVRAGVGHEGRRPVAGWKSQLSSGPALDGDVSYRLSDPAVHRRTGRLEQHSGACVGKPESALDLAGWPPDTD